MIKNLVNFNKLERINMKTYCNDCKYLKWKGALSFEACKIVVDTKDTPTKKVRVYADYSVLNENNNCEYFKPTLQKHLFSKISNLIKT